MDFRPRFESPATILVSGGTSSGKSYLVARILKHADSLFSKKVHEIMYCYGVWTELYSKMEANREIDNLHFHHGLPTKQELDEFADPNLHKIICVDDLLKESSGSDLMEDLFTRDSHHKNISVIYISQNLFYSGSGGGGKNKNRTISLNTQYFLLTSNYRSVDQIGVLGSQIKKRTFLLYSYNDVLDSGNYGYLRVDLSPHGDRELIFTTHIFPDDPEPLVFYSEVN